MNQHLSRLFKIAHKQEKRIIGLMSGTSLDGLDIALCTVSGSGLHTYLQLTHFETISYPETVRDNIRAVFSKDYIDLQQLCLLNPWIARLHAGYILDFLSKRAISPCTIDLIASHGQTIFHAPRSLHKQVDWPDATLQIGDGDHIAMLTGIITISDFRQKHIAAGGEGAPLAVYGDYILFSSPKEARIMLNLGGIANFTYLPQRSGHDPAGLVVTDTGPGNTLLDACTRLHFRQAFDQDALLARQGTVNTDLLHALLSDDFFSAGIPKSTGPELFNMAYLQKARIASNTESVGLYDMLATLTHFSALSVTRALKDLDLPDKACSLYASGGGAHNPLLMELISRDLGQIRIRPIEELGISEDAKEAVLFAVLANETISGRQELIHDANIPACTMGKISLPG